MGPIGYVIGSARRCCSREYRGNLPPPLPAVTDALSPINAAQGECLLVGNPSCHLNYARVHF